MSFQFLIVYLFILATFSALQQENVQEFLQFDRINKVCYLTSQLSSWNFRPKSLVAGNLNTRHQFWNIAISNPSDQKLLDFSHANEYRIPSPQYSSQCFPARNTDVFYVVVYRNLFLSNVIFSDIPDLYNLQIIFLRVGSCYLYP